MDEKWVEFDVRNCGEMCGERECSGYVGWGILVVGIFYWKVWGGGWDIGISSFTLCKCLEGYGRNKS